MDINYQRAWFVYEASRLQAISVDAPVIPEPWEQRETDFKDQLLKVIEQQCGDNRFESPEAAHNSWWNSYLEMGWKYGPVRDVVNKTHPDMVPFDELEPRERDKDIVFLLLCDIARQWIKEYV